MPLHCKISKFIYFHIKALIFKGLTVNQDDKLLKNNSLLLSNGSE